MSTDSDSSPSIMRAGISFVVCLAGGLLAVFMLHQLTASFRTGVISVIWTFVLTIGMTGTMILIGLVLGKLTKGASSAFVLVGVLVVICEVSWYWWDYQNFKTQVAAVSVSGEPADALTADAFLISESGSPGFWGYLKWSAYQGAVTEDSGKIPAGGFAAIVNWGKRLLSLFWALVWAFIGLSTA